MKCNLLVISKRRYRHVGDLTRLASFIYFVPHAGPGRNARDCYRAHPLIQHSDSNGSNWY